jgi:hypothetical protein
VEGEKKVGLAMPTFGRNASGAPPAM